MIDSPLFGRALTLCLLLAGCGEAGPAELGSRPLRAESLTISTDRAAYSPGEAVTLTLERAAPADARVRYEHLGRVVEESAVPGTSWSWTPPATDYQGYLAELYTPTAAGDDVVAAVGIDVSSDWSRFPRYGFLFDFGQKSDGEIESVLDDLDRHHINGLQFFDWHYEHHLMLPGPVGDPPASWTNISGRPVYLSTVAGYIAAAHARNMKAMFYNLVYGALKDAAAAGVQDSWYLYRDPNQTTRNVFTLPSPPFVSDIWLMDPSNPGWQAYLVRDVDKVYAALPFDGYHMDQLGNQGAEYRADGTPVDLAASFGGLIDVIHQAHPEKYLVMNAVDQYGQAGIAAAPTAFLYTEVWPPHDSYADLAQLVLDDDALANGQKNAVLAAYVNYGLAYREGVFNTPAVLMADAVIFAFGGDHLELGEHMLGQEYFPNDNLGMRSDLVSALVPYYDFLVAYENLLRDGGTFNTPGLTTSGSLPLAAWPAGQGSIAFVGKQVGDREVIHLLNFTDATTMSWRDDGGIQAYPEDRRQIPLTLATDRQVARIWYATPDRRLGASQQIAFTQSGGEVSFTLPFLRYWSMVVVEYQ